MNRIKELREQKGWSVRDLSVKSGVSKAPIYNYETEYSRPRIKAAHKLAAALGTDIAYMMGWEDEPIKKAAKG